MLGKKLLCVWLGLTLGLIVFTVFTQGPTSQIYERSFFQGCALLTAWLVLK
jgi:hypothetical protein